MNKKIKYIICCLGVMAFIAGSILAGTTLENVSVTGYDPTVNYMQLIIDAVDDGSKYALEVATIYERQRNLKIETEGLELEKTYFLEQELSYDELTDALLRYLYPDPELYYALSDAERDLVERVVMAEAGGQSYEGQMMVAQCILDGSIRLGMGVEDTIIAYRYTKNRPTPSDSVKRAVSEVFDLGKRVTTESADLFYNPAITTSSWHESQTYVCTIGSHRFFKMN